jgi:glutamate/tyrosine decarboxylase-like PLP-dependent enzyme
LLLKAHSCVEKAAMISLVKVKLLPFDKDYSLRGDTLKKAIEEDIEKGLIPFYVSVNLTTYLF